MPRKRDLARAKRLMHAAARRLDSDIAAAEASYREAVVLDPGLDRAWFDLGLIGKSQGRWDLAFDANQKAIEAKRPGKEDPAWWNLGIAATALRRWDVAREAWQRYGLDIPDGDGEVAAHLGTGPVRLNPKTDGEVVWGERIDPARVRVLSIPFPASGHRWGDIVLHDGAPNGYREFDGIELPVFDELERWAPSDVPTVEVAVGASRDAVEDLLGRLDAARIPAEDWTTNVRMLCVRCSEGRVHAEHRDESLNSGTEHLIGAAGHLTEIEEIVRAWMAATDGVSCHWLEEAQ